MKRLKGLTHNLAAIGVGLSYCKGVQTAIKLTQEYERKQLEINSLKEVGITPIPQIFKLKVSDSETLKHKLKKH